MPVIAVEATVGTMQQLRASSSCSSGRVKRKVYKTRDDAKADIFDYIEMFYNPKRRHGNNKNLSPMDYEKSYTMKVKSV